LSLAAAGYLPVYLLAGGGFIGVNVIYFIAKLMSH
jgi:hypothetical protein